MIKMGGAIDVDDDDNDSAKIPVELNCWLMCLEFITRYAMNGN